MKTQVKLPYTVLHAFSNTKTQQLCSGETVFVNYYRFKVSKDNEVDISTCFLQTLVDIGVENTQGCLNDGNSKCILFNTEGKECVNAVEMAVDLKGKTDYKLKFKIGTITLVDGIKTSKDVKSINSLKTSESESDRKSYDEIMAKLKEKGLNVEDVELSPNGDLFVRSSKRKGILPEILESLLAARKQAKKDMEAETDPFKITVLNGRQLALKISANSVYGFTGAQIGKLPCMQIASSVTSYGRAMIDLTKNTVEEHYTKKNGYPWDAQVIYGDTDSVMVKFGTTDLAEAIKMGKEAAEFVTTKFPKPINLEFEKVFFPYLLISKKRYAGLYFNRADKWDHVDTKGIETVRRDNCILVKYIIENVLNKILLNSDVEGAIEFVKKTISELLQNKLDLSMLIISKALSKEDYAGKQAHVELAKRIRERDKSAVIYVGDRIPYVIVKSTKDAKAYEKWRRYYL